MEEQFDKEIHALAQQIKGMHDQAVAVYNQRPLRKFPYGLHRL